MVFYNTFLGSMSSNESVNSENSADSPTRSNAPDSNNSLGQFTKL